MKGLARPELCGSDPVPKEWRFEREEQDFEAVLEAFLWAACDVALGAWRRKVLSPDTTQQGDGIKNLQGRNKIYI